MKATLTVLGSGTSMGVPTIGCTCAVCHSPDPHDRRTRPSVLIEYAGKTVLIDTTPDFREQAIREGITKIDAVLYTHSHADHILGIDDLRPLSYHRDGKIPLYARAEADFSQIPEESFSRLQDLDVLFLDGLRYKPHPTHSTVENSLRIADRLKAKRVFFTHICHDLPHEATNATLPPHVRLSYDGMKLEFEI